MRRIRLFIVDDEIASIRYFKSVLGEGERYELAGEALDAGSALREITRQKPDITFVDVCMPDMDGITLTEKILEANPGGRILLLTSYKNFDYIKRGYTAGISGYLLKHEITRELLRGEIDRNYAENEQERLRYVLYSQYHVQRYLEGKTDDMPRFLLLDGERRGQLFFLFAAVADSALDAEAEELAGDCEKLASSSFPAGLECRIAFAARRNIWVGLISMESQPSAQAMRGSQYETAMIVRRFFRERPGTVSVLLSGLARESEAIPIHYLNLLSASGRTFLLGRDQICFLGELQPPVGRPEDYDALLSAFSEAMTHLGGEEAVRLMEWIFAQAALSADLEYYRSVVRDLLLLINRFCLFYSVEKPLRSGGVPMLQSVEEVAPWFRAAIGRCIQSVLEKQTACYSKRIQSAVVYIQQNFAENISIDDIAGAVYLSGGHLRHLFKKEVGVTIVDYLAEYRIDMAKKYLREGMVRVGEVYAKVGFASSQYFASVFKKVTGLTPTEYGRLAEGEQRAELTCAFI